MKKYMMTFLGIVLLFQVLSVSAVTKGEVEARIKQSYNQTFGSGINVLTNRFVKKTGPAMAIYDWENTVDLIEDYVQENSSDLMKYFNAISAANNAVINTLKAVYNSVIAGALLFPQHKQTGVAQPEARYLDPKKLDLATIERLIHPTLINERKKLMDVQKDLKGKTLVRSSSREVRDVLLRFAQSVEDAINKALFDYEKLKQFKKAN